MHSRTLAVLLAFMFAAVWAHAADLKLPADQEYFYWFSYTNAAGNAETTTPAKSEGPKDEIDYAELGTGSENVVLNVLDPEAGNIAVHQLRPVDDELPESIVLKKVDFDRVRNVEIAAVSKDGKPVESALVTLTDAENKKYVSVVEPTSQGVAKFQDIAAGTVTVKINCAGRKSINDINIPLERDSLVFREEIPVPGDIPTLEAVKTASAEAETAAEKERTRRQISPTMLLQTLVGLIFLALVAYVGITVARSRGITFASALKRAGVQLPEEPDASGAPAQGAATAGQQADPSICQFCGQKKDEATGACGCTVAAAPVTAASGPRLVGTSGQYLGSVFEISGDNVTIGRETSNSVALNDDATTSRHHARIVRQNDQFVIQDEGSANGTLVNGAKISQPTPISAGDEIQIGSTKFRFEQ